MNIAELNIYLQTKKNELNGGWISKNSGYEKGACINLGFNCQRKRYWDCEYNGTYIEMKKGNSIWLDEVRYSEILMCDKIDNIECKKETITMETFFCLSEKDFKMLKGLFAQFSFSLCEKRVSKSRKKTLNAVTT